MRCVAVAVLTTTEYVVCTECFPLHSIVFCPDAPHMLFYQVIVNFQLFWNYKGLCFN